MTSVVRATLLATFVFWTGTTMGAVAFAALLQITGAEWPGRLRREAERFRAALLVSCFVAPAFVIGMPMWFAWRDAVAIVAIFALSTWFSQASAATTPSGSHDPRVTARAVAFLVVYAVGSGLLAVDLAMSLQPTWRSTLFPGYLSIAGLYTGIAATVVISAWRAPESALDEARANDAGSLILGFALLWMYLVWSQYLVVWYGNLPPEIDFLLRRMTGVWPMLVWVVIGARFVAPLAICMPRAGRRRAPLAVVSLVILAGFWVECLLIVGPSPGIAR